MITCLSETIRNDSLGSSNPMLRLEKQHRVSQSCRQQLRIQLFQQHEDVKFNPGVHQPCERDEKKFCSSVKPGQGRILECLKNNRKKLEASCHAAIFKVEKEEMDDNSVDFPLRSTCKEPIQHFCKNDMTQALDCLKASIRLFGKVFLMFKMQFFHLCYTCFNQVLALKWIHSIPSDLKWINL